MSAYFWAYALVISVGMLCFVLSRIDNKQANKKSIPGASVGIN